MQLGQYNVRAQERSNSREVRTLNNPFSHRHCTRGKYPSNPTTTFRHLQFFLRVGTSRKPAKDRLRHFTQLAREYAGLCTI